MDIKKCEVLTSNDLCSAVKFNGLGDVQIPYPNLSGVVVVKHVNGQFTLSDEDELSKQGQKIEATDTKQIPKKGNLVTGVIHEKNKK